MGKYYCLIAGLPNITLDDSKIAYSVVEFREELQSILSRKDRSVVDLFFLKYDNKNILSYLEKKDQAEFDSRGNFSLETIDFLYKTLKEEGVLLSSKQYPSYFLTFLEQYISEEQGESNSGKRKIPWEDRLSALYYEYVMKCKNRFVSEWFELNLNVSNILTAIVCRKFGLEKENYIVGDNGVAEQLKMSNAQDFGMGNLLDYFSELQRLMEETNLQLREKGVDLLRWNWLDENTFFKPFDIESVFAYLVKLEMIERWISLDKETGEKTFREIVSVMKKGSLDALEEFKRNNNK